MKTVDIEPFIRPSSTGENALCAGRPLMQATMVALHGKREAAPEANMGHKAHAWGESGVRLLTTDMDDMEPLEEVADIESVIRDLRRNMAEARNGGQDCAVDTWTERVVEDYVRFIHGLIVKHGISPDNVLVEERLDMTDIGFRNGGTSDCILVVPFKLVIVVDLKAGFLEQEEAADHSQIAGYGVSAALRFQTKDVMVFIAQPRQEKSKRFSGATFDAAAIKETAAWISSVNNRCRATNPELTAGYAQCANCQALARCAAAKEMMMNAQEALETLGMPLDADGRGALADAAKLAERFADAGKEIVKAALKAGESATGWKLGSPRALRSVANPGQALATLAANGITMRALSEMEAVTIKLGALTPEAEAFIAEHITEKLSDPPLTQNKAGRK